MTMTDRSMTESSETALAVALQSVAVECVHFDGAERPAGRRLMPLAGLLAPLGGLVSPALRDGLRDAS
ncbi:hypothetical protein C0V75_14445 [Tabrizicola sp. TH137]|uniref:hypothetical protein n=1 Tax=Tabrizicola sp. TH137 TaxID=2067452 RepID=UPI000C7E1BF9|nr:hypothetical protein [Tabrizicola sp. TH137]PLL12079.1 hypothetical protein C0V75_14445 [Tabrizicola sp. TH137]